MEKIKDEIFWTGYIDRNLREFHGYLTPHGSTYNAYLILDQEPTLIDTVKHYGFEEMLARIKKVIDPVKIKYIVSNHTEMDHSGCIEKLLEYCPQAQVVCSPKGKEGLKKHFKKEWNFHVVQTGDTLNIGRRTLKFFLAPMVHWPDSMATYLEEDKILFSNDAFGQHYASEERFVEEIGEDIIFHEAEKYYANIVLPYGAQVLKVLEALTQLKIETIAPSHGLIWRIQKDIEKIITLYKKWASYHADSRVVIIYDTMWHSTEKMAKTIFSLLEEKNILVNLYSLQTTHISDVLVDVMRSKFVLLGSPILNNQVLPTVGALLTYLKGLKPKNRFAFTFGSFGWSQVGFRDLEKSLEEAGMQLFGQGKYFQYVPSEQDLESFSEVVKNIKKTLEDK